MEIKIVGSITDEKTLDEITSIARVFVYENRIKNFNYTKSNFSPTLKKPIELYKKNAITKNLKTNPYNYFMVKGLM